MERPVSFKLLSFHNYWGHCVFETPTALEMFYTPVHTRAFPQFYRVRVSHHDVLEVICTAVSKLRLQMDPPTVWSARATVSLVNERIRFLILRNQERF